MMNRRSWLAGMIGASLLVLSACSGGNAENAAAGNHMQHRLSNGDIQETTAPVSALPEFLGGQPAPVRQVYQLAAQNTDLLQGIPCYCGCGDSAGHTSNMNCFVHEKKKDGSVVWDDHGTRCMVCMEIAVQAVKMKQDGKTPGEIRQAIDENYGKGGYAKPTPTPKPSA